MVKRLLFLYLVSFIFLYDLYAKGSPHAGLFIDKSTNNYDKKFCLFCHKLRNSGDIKPKWKIDNISSYKDYISATLDPKDVMVDSMEVDYEILGIVDLCLSCHNTTYTRLDHGHSHNAQVIGNKVVKNIKLDKEGKVEGKLKLYNNYMTCTTCHDPHSATFKLLTDSRERICVDCHDK